MISPVYNVAIASIASDLVDSLPVRARSYHSVCYYSCKHHLQMCVMGICRTDTFLMPAQSDWLFLLSLASWN